MRCGLLDEEGHSLESRPSRWHDRTGHDKSMAWTMDASCSFESRTPPVNNEGDLRLKSTQAFMRRVRGHPAGTVDSALAAANAARTGCVVRRDPYARIGGTSAIQIVR